MAAAPSATGVSYMKADWYNAAKNGKFSELSADDLRDQLTPQGNNLLHIACQFGKKTSVTEILGKLRGSPSGSFLKKTNLKGETALHLAAREGHLEVVKALIEKAEAGGAGEDKALMRMENKKGETALHEAVRYNHQKVVELLVEKDPDGLLSHGGNCSSPLYLAAERGYAKLVEIIIAKCSSSADYAGLDDRTALHAAVIGRHIEVTNKILERKADLITKVDAKGWSPLHYAAYLKDDISAKAILNKAPNRSVIYLGIKDGNRTALHIASLVGCKAIVELLLERAPDCKEQVDAHGQNVFHFAVMNNYRSNLGSELLKLKELQVRGLVNERDQNEHTPFRLLAISPKIPSTRGDTSGGFGNDEPFTGDKMVDEMERKNKELYDQKEKMRNSGQLKAEEMKKMPTLVTLSI